MKKLLSEKRTLYFVSIGLTFLLASLSFGSAAHAGQLATNGASISWDDSRIYYPSGCSSISLSYTLDPSVLIADVRIVNAFGDEVGSSLLMGEGTSGSAGLQVCNFDVKPTGAPFQIVLEVQQSHVSGDGSSSIVEAPFTFLTRNSGTTGVARTYVCVKKGNFKVKKAPASRFCNSGWVLRSFKN